MADSPVPPPLDPGNPITPLQSATILNALKAMAPQVIILIATVTGKTFDIDAINHLIDSGYSLIATLFTLYYLCRTIKSRINATQTIQTKGKP